MGFFWKQNALFTRRIEHEYNPNTVFFLKYRETSSSLPHLLPLCQFLATSLTFIGLETIELFVDDWNILTLSRKAAPVETVTIPKEINPKTSGNVMKIAHLHKGIAQLDGQWMDIVGWRPPKPGEASMRHHSSRTGDNTFRSFFSKLAGGPSVADLDRTSKSIENKVADSARDLSQTHKASCFLQIFKATLSASPSTTARQELERATKKPPPKVTNLSVLIPAFETGLQGVDERPFADVFATVLPTKSNGKIFIGFPTQQTTALGCHISAPSIIPTVEREAIDLNARSVKDWNLELLRAAGIICRVAWTTQMKTFQENIAQTVKNKGQSKTREEDVTGVLSGFIAAARTFTFKESTPLANVGTVIEDVFWTCSKKASIEFLSTCGILPTHQIRNAPKDLSFMTDIAVIPEGVVKEAGDLVSRLVDYGLVTDVTPSDIKSALESMPLSSKQLIEFTAWISRKAAKRELDESTVKLLMGVAIGTDEVEKGGSGKLIVMSGIDRFLTANKIPASMPVPPSVMPFAYTKNIPPADLNVLGWEELQVVPWARWLVEESGNRGVLPVEHDITKNADFARSVLPILSKAFDSASTSSRESLVQTLIPRTVIPTKLGMRKPSDAYFQTVKLFDDLPSIHLLNGVKEKFLAALGVRKTLELSVIFDRLLPTAGSTPSTGNTPRWNHIDLIKYLTSVRDDIPKSDIQKLRETNFCIKESGSNKDQKQHLYRINELFEPKSALRDLNLPILQWSGPYRNGSPEDKFLYTLGLRSHPTVQELVQIIADAIKNSDEQLRGRGMGYFLNHHHTNGYAAFDYNKISTPFLPLQDSDSLAVPSQCFANEGAALLGFKILERTLQLHAPKFGVRNHPPIESCLDVLIQNPPVTRKDARATFGYFASRLGEVSLQHVQKLTDANFIPISVDGSKVEKDQRHRYISPRQCFLGDSDSVYKDMFNFCDFGQEANSFLLRCGSKPEPTKVEVAWLLVQDPQNVLSILASAEKYLNLLRSLGDNLAVLKKDKALIKAMAVSPCLLASRSLSEFKYATAADHSDNDDADEEDAAGLVEWHLTTAQEAIIIDDFTSLNIFRSKIFAAPQEDGLEAFYRTLGSPLLSESIEIAARHGRPVNDQRPAQRLQKQIYERSKLFLHEQAPSSIKHDSRWLEKNVNVEAVSTISFRRNLKCQNITNEEKRSAVITRGNSGYTLWITAGLVDYYQVSQALCSVLLSKASNQLAITLEMILKTELRELGARGINVSRILRQKAEQARLAEVRLQQEIEVERNRLELEQATWQEEQARKISSGSDQKSVPGGFPDSPDHAHAQAPLSVSKLPQVGDDSSGRASKGIFSNLSRRFGLEDGGRTSRHLQSLLGNAPAEERTSSQLDQHPPPPPYSADDTQTQSARIPQVATSPFQIQQNLLSAIQKSRPYQSSSLYSRGESHEVSEASSYCDERPAHDLTFAADIPHGLRVFMPKGYSKPSEFLSQNTKGLSLFASVLKDVASIFSVRLDCINVFYMPDSKSIAFNRDGTIFCNYFFFEQYHLSGILSSPAKRAQAIRYWWVTLCHEIAHNLVESHSAAHSYYLESLVEFSFEKAAKVMTAPTTTAPAPTTSVPTTTTSTSQQPSLD